MYDAAFAAVYDEIYRGHRDYAGESRGVRDLALSRRPQARSLLDVGCGTGEHLTYLRDEFEVAGVELSEPMAASARAKLGDVPVHRADMRGFDLGRTFDVVVSLYSSVGYLGEAAELESTLRAMAGHLVRGGVVIVEPWFLREDWNGGDLVSATFEGDGATVSRMGKWGTRDGRSFVEMHYLVGDGSGVRHFVDRQELTLFSRAEYERAFTGAGCSVEFLREGHADRGVFVGVKQA